MEMNEVRPFFSKSMSTLIQLKPDNVDMLQDAVDTGDYA